MHRRVPFTTHDIKRMPLDEARKVLAGIQALAPEQQAALVDDWHFWARDSQLPPPGDWFTWLLKTGRGFGKTRSAAEWVLEEIMSGRRRRVALIAQDAGDVRDVMIEGPSGIRTIAPPAWRPQYIKGQRKLIFPNGAIAKTYSSRDPGDLRGPEHDGAWADEVAAWYHLDETLSNLTFGLRLAGPKGDQPRMVVTTTPRPLKALRDLIDDESTVVSEGSTWDNAENLAKAALSKFERYRGTRIGEQELEGRLLEQAEGALWTVDILASTRVKRRPSSPNAGPPLARVCIAIDPMAGAKLTERRKMWPPETGIIAAGATSSSEPSLYVLGDHSVHGGPEIWAERAIQAYEKHQADCIVAEVNQGGDMVEDVLRTRGFKGSVILVRATRGKYTRAEPVSSLWHQGRAHMVGVHRELEDQLCMWTGAEGEASPDRLDALVWAGTHLIVDAPAEKVTPVMDINSMLYRR